MAESTPIPESPLPAKQTRSSGRFWRRARRAAIALLALLVIGVVALTQTNLVGSLVLARVRTSLGCDAVCHSVRVTWSGQVIVRDIELRAPGVDGPGALFFQAPEVTIYPVWMSLLSRSPRIDRIELRQPIVRICQDDSLRLNVQGLATGAAPGGGLTPTVNVADGVVELGEFGPGWYTPLTSLRVHGKLARVAPNSTRYVVQLVEPQRPGTAPTDERLKLDGEFDLVTLSGSLRLDSVDFARFRDVPAPSRIEPLWRQLALAGSLRDTEFSYSREQGVSAVFRLERVDMNIPLPAERPDPGQGGESTWTEELLRMRGVSGTIRLDRAGLHADLAGTIEDLGCHVTLETEGFTLDSALVCTIRADEFRVSEQPRLLPFAPAIVRRNFERFSGPTALVTGEVEIRRSAPNEAAPSEIAVNGLISFAEGSARFEKFPYPFANLAGSVRFDETKVVIERVSGVGPTGARLEATGIVAPPVETAGVHVEVLVTEVPADDVLYEAIPTHRRSMYDALFSRDEYVTLQAAGIVQSEESQRSAVARRAELERQVQRLQFEADSGPRIAQAHADMAALDARLVAPVFQLAGTCEIRVDVRRPEGPDEEYRTTILVSLPRAGLLPEAFPYPIVAHDFTLQIDDERAVADAPVLQGLSGASGSMRALIEFMPEGPDDFDIRVHATAVSVDDALLAALERRDRAGAQLSAPADSPTLGQWSPARLIRALGVRGSGVCDAHIVSNDHGNVTYTIDVGFDDVQAQPGGADLELAGIVGALTVTQDMLRIRNLSGRIGSGFVTADVGVTGLRGMERGDVPIMAGAIEMTGLELHNRVERIVEAFAPQHASALARLREEHEPSGRIDASITLGTSDADLEYRVDLSRPHAVSLTALGGRLAIRDSSGLFSIGHDALRCNDFKAILEYEREPAGELALDGVWPLQKSDGSTGALSVELRGGQFASPIVRAFASSLDETAASWLRDSELRGAFDASGVAHTTASGETYFSGALIPHSISVARGGVRTTIDPVQGRITFGPDGGMVESLSGAAADWSFTAHGAWARLPAPGLDLTLSIEAEGLSDSLVALLPELVGDTRSAIGLSIDGPLSIRDARLQINALPADGAPRLSLKFGAGFENASIDPGVALRTDRGAAQVVVQSSDAGSPPALDITIQAPAFTAMGVRLADGSVHIRSGGETGVYLFEDGRASAHGGELAVEGSIRLAASAATPAYELELRAAGMDFAFLMEELARSPAGATEGDGDAVESAPPVVAGSRGMLDAYIGLAGPIGDGAARRGAGIIRVAGGEVIALPGLTGLLRLSNLQPPIGEVLDHASALFHVRGQEVEFERIEAASDSFAIVGAGTMLWPSTELDLTFNTRGSAGVPILSDLFRGLRDEIVTTEMTGRLQAPESRIVQLPATRRMLGTIFRGEPRNQPPEATKAADPGRELTQETTTND